MPASRPLTAGPGLFVFAALLGTAVVLLIRDQGVPVELEAEPNGAGYLSKSVDGIAAKVLLEQAQEAAQIARKRLEKAAEYHNQAEDAKKEYAELKQREAAAQEAIQRDEEESADAEKQGAAALIEAKEALKGRDVHEKQAQEFKDESEVLSKKAVELNDEGEKYQKSASEASEEAERAKATIRQLKAEIAIALHEMDELKRQLIARENWQPAQEGQGARSSPLQLASRHGMPRFSGASARSDEASARNSLAQGVSDNFVPVNKASQHTW